jgi:hypothetical protein
MKTKRETLLLFLSAIGLAFFFTAVACAGDRVYAEPEGFSGYGVAYSSVVASSATAGVIQAMGNDGWREISCIANDMTKTTIINSRVSSTIVSTTTLATSGGRFPFTANQGRHWNTSKRVYFSVPAGSASVTLDCEIWTER